MSNIHDINSLNRREEEASLWVIKLDRGLSELEKQELNQWLSNEANHNMFFMMAETWDKVDSLSQLATLFQPSIIRHKAKKFTQLTLALAASVTFCAFFIWAYISVSFDMSEQDIQTVNSSKHLDSVYQTAVGQYSTIDLIDGSKLTINTNSLVKVTYTASQRLINLVKGEIFIDVAHDKTRPLSVIVNGTIFQAVGTAFNVKKSFGENIELLVTDGKVMIAELLNHQETDFFAQEAKLSTDNVHSALPGEKVVIKTSIQEKQEIEILNNDDMEASLSWLDRKLIFRGQTLQEAMDEISFYTDATFVIPEKLLRERKIAGVFQTNDIELLLDTLDENFNIQHKKTKNGKILLVSVNQ